MDTLIKMEERLIVNEEEYGERCFICSCITLLMICFVYLMIYLMGDSDNSLSF